jgi:hypothetical protein
MATPHEEAGALLQPILDLMGGTDGGVGFAKLRHDFLPEMLKQADGGNYTAEEFIKMVQRFSKLCELLMEKP